jgi:hypothetical protein
MKEIVDNYLALKSAATKHMMKYVMDKSIPLSERWYEFVRSGLGEDDYYYFDSHFVDVSVYYNDADKYSVSSVEDLVTRLANQGIDETIIDNVKEEMLNAFKKSYTYNW